MKTPYSLKTTDKLISTTNPETILDSVEEALQAGERFTLAIAKSASRTLKQVNNILSEHGVELRIDPNSDPEAGDYVINALFGGVVGASVGAGTGLAVWTIARAVGSATPLAPFIIAGSVVGFALGSATGLAFTHWGLTVRFAAKSKSVEMEFVPLA